MEKLEIDLHSEADTQRFGKLLAEHLPVGATVCLIGTLGAGKTRLVQAVATARGMDPKSIVSPTFTLCNEYPGHPGICHLDLYRVVDEDDLLELGIEEYFSRPELTFVEWADRFPDFMPPDRCEIELEITGETSRHVSVSAHGTECLRTLDAVHKGWSVDPPNPNAPLD